MTGIRASDADRDSCLDDIEAAYADGRLNDAEREIRTQKALQATTLDELARLVSDLGPGAVSRVGGRTRRRRGPGEATTAPLVAVVAIVVAVAVLVVGSAFVWPGWATGSDDPTDFQGLPGQAEPAGDPDDDRDQDVEAPDGRLALHTAKGFSTFVKLTRQKFGTTLVESAAIYPDYASVNVALKDDPRRTERWYFAKGYEGSPTKGSRPRPDSPLVDVARIDIDALVRNVKRAPSVLGVSDIKSTYLVLDERGGEPSYSVYVSNDYSETGYYSFDLSGKEVFRYTFE